MRHASRRPAVLVLLAMVASLLGVITPTAAFADTIPTLQWPAVASRAYEYAQTTTSPQGDVTVGCTGNTTQDLKTYGNTGTVTRQINRTTQVDGVNNCINRPAVDKNGVVYGKPTGSSKLLAYQGNTLKWSYDTGCTSSSATPVVGADGNVYFIDSSMHLVGLAPNLASGQTVPTKVVDVAIKGGCSQGNLLYAYKDGIAAEWNYGTRLQYISYNGAILGDAPTSAGYQQGNTPINAVGRLFYPTYVAGSGFQSVTVSAWDPMTSTATWSTSASTPGANVQQYKAYPLPGGGVLAVIKEQKMIADNVPVTPTEYITNLVTLNSAGTKIGSVKLANKDASGNSYGDNYYAVDTTGKVVVVRVLTKSLSSWPYQVPITSVLVFDASSGSTTYQGTLAGDTANTYGYNALDLDGTNVIGPNTVYINTNKCGNDCNTSTDYKLWAVKVQGLGMDYPRGDVLSRTARSSASYVALGDSFSSGEGVPPFESATDIPGVNTCHRSTTAYARLIAGTSSKIPSLGTGGFRACSGAVTTNVTDLQQWNESIQLDWWPDATTQLVTLTIGGNDIGFANFATACVTGTCQVGSSAYNTALDKINNNLASSLEATYKRILTYAPNAQIYVLDYPQVIGDKQSSDPFDSRCPYMYNSGSNSTGSSHYPWEDAWAARDIVTKLDTKISGVITSVRAQNTDYHQRLHYVPTNGAGSPFTGRELCGTETTSWFQNVDQGATNLAYVFHPNADGQQGYATVASAEINAG